MDFFFILEGMLLICYLCILLFYIWGCCGMLEFSVIYKEGVNFYIVVF